MDKHAIMSLRVVSIVLVLAASHAHANMYKWIAEDGSVTYSNKLPEDRTKVRELTQLETAPPARPAPTNIAQATIQNVDPLFVFVPPAPRQPAAQVEPAAPGSQPEIVITPKNGSGVRADLPPTAAYRGAAQDPCLRSPDPRCYELNKDRYHPFLGYMPAAAAPAVGATVGSAGGGVVAGGSTR
ncbi:MAG TPA: DUF4124 domain-containing protein [Burkholderiales bacterium]|nr:DUF4124 domain-containing protein [Burkholderiales bacterium]